MDIKALISKMSFREKVYQLLQLTSDFFSGSGDVDLTGPIQDFKIAPEDMKLIGSVLNTRSAEDLIAIQKKYIEQNPSGIPLIFMLNVVHGYRTIYPVNLGLACSFDTELVSECSKMAAKEATLEGCSVTFGPMVDIARDARWGRAMESSGEDPYLGAKIAEATVKGFEGDMGKYNLATCVKHFAAYGAAEAGMDYNTVDMSERTLREYFLPTYKAAVDAGARTLMTAFNIVDGIPAVANKHLLCDILRGEWGYKGLIISDFCAAKELMAHGVAEDHKAAAEMVMNAGLDMEMMSVAYINYLEELVAEGRVSLKQIDDAVYRVLKLKEECGLFESPYGHLDLDEAKAVILSEEHRAIARRAAEEGAVLLENDGILPLAESVESIALIGPHIENGEIIGKWSCMGKPCDTVTVLDGMKKLYTGSRIECARGVFAAFDSKDESGIAEAVKIAERCDTVILTLGEEPDDSGEGRSKMYIDLPDVQYKLLDEIYKVNKNIIVLLFTGRPLSVVRLREKARAVLCTWWPGTEGGNAIANLISGRVSPSGKLAMTFPYSVGQCPIYYNHYNSGRPRPDDERRYNYKCAYIDGPNSPLYSFGYGLSYTSFSYSEVKLSDTVLKKGGKITASVELTNTGDREGTETVQLYIRDLVGSVTRPVKELRGFERVTLGKGESKFVSFDIDEETLAFYGQDLQRRAEAGEFHVFIGGDSRVNSPAKFTLV